jgi:hypothetical protein
MKCCIVIPVYRVDLSPEERLLLESVRKYLSGYDIRFVCPDSFPCEQVALGHESCERFPAYYFAGLDGYNSLLKSVEFYQRFASHDYILICQLDCLVLRDELESWMSKGFDYIGAPWFPWHQSERKSGDELWRCGNGGFSLRNVKAHLKILQTVVPKGSIYPLDREAKLKTKNAARERGSYQIRKFWYRVLHPWTATETVEQSLERFPFYEDSFWSIEAPKFDRSFRVPSAEEALPFAFEVDPRWCYEKNKRQLPFGCHAWAKYDKEFWMEVLNKAANEA